MQKAVGSQQYCFPPDLNPEEEAARYDALNVSLDCLVAPYLHVL